MSRAIRTPSYCAPLCYAAREKAEIVLREQSRMPDVIRESVAKAKAHATERIEQFESRLARISGDGAVTIHHELEFERAFRAAKSRRKHGQTTPPRRGCVECRRFLATVWLKEEAF
jgi:hypothetical protein